MLALTAPELCTRLRFRPAGTGRTTAIALAGGLAVPLWGEPTARLLRGVVPAVGGFVDALTQALVPSAPRPILRDPDALAEPGERRRPWLAPPATRSDLRTGMEDRVAAR